MVEEKKTALIFIEKANEQARFSKEELDKVAEEGDVVEKYVYEHLDYFGVNEEKLTSLTYLLDEQEENSIKEVLKEKLSPQQIKQIDETPEFRTDTHQLEGNPTREEIVIHTLYERFRRFNNRVNSYKQYYVGQITAAYNKKIRGGFDFAQSFKKNGKVDYSDDFIEKNAKWIVKGHGNKSYYRFELCNKQQYYTDKSAELADRIKRILK